MTREGHQIVGWDGGLVRVRLPAGEAPVWSDVCIIREGTQAAMARLDYPVLAMERRSGCWDLFMTPEEYHLRYNDEVII